MIRLVLALPLVLVLSACAKEAPLEPIDENSTGGSGSLKNGSMSASINGSAFNATSSLTTFTTLGSGVLPATLTVSGVSGTRTLSFSLSGSGIGTFTVAAADVNFVITEGAAGWQGLLSAAGSSGSVTLTTWTAERAVGTFSIIATPTPGTGSSANRTVTDGRFDVTF
jgi:hypothetical protein